MQHILVTGATGFIGSNLVRKLVQEQMKVTALVRDKLKTEIEFSELKEKENLFFFQWNHSVFALAEYMKENKVDCVVHLATKYITQSTAEDIDELVEGNIVFGMKVLEAMKLANIKNFINSSTSWQHYQNEIYCPTNVYAATKQAFEDILKYYTNAEQIRAIVLEIYDTYGAFDKRNKLLNAWKKLVATGEGMALSPGEQSLDYVYIEDVLSGILQAINILNELPVEANGYERKYALSTDETYTLKEIAQLFEEVYEKKLSITWGGKPYREREVMEPYRGLERLPGWNTNYDLRNGLKEMKQKEQGKAVW